MKFNKQARSEFGRTWAAPRGEAAATTPPAPAAGGGQGSGAATGQAVASFYGSLVQTSGRGWVSGGTLQDGEPAAPVAVPPAACQATAAAAAGPAGAEPSHAGLGSAAARAEQEAEAAALQYPAPAGPAPRGGQEVAIQPPAATWVQQPQQQGRRGPQEGVRYGIARSNLGFQLLKKAGWTEGSGLGAQEQGMAEPVAAFQQKGNLGLGYAPKPPKPAKKEGAAAGTAGGAAGGAAGGGQPAAPKRPLPEDPLDKEDTETKVKRVKQVMQAEADDIAGKAIARYMRMAFSDRTGEPTSDSNPLLRRNHKLRATNPLL